MIPRLIEALIKDLLYFLKKEKGFFALEKKKREILAKEYFGIIAFSHYLVSCQEKQFIDDLRICFAILKGDVIKTHSLLIDSFRIFLIEEFPKIKELNEKTRFFKTISYELRRLSSQEINEEILEFLEKYYGSPRILIQSPIPCDKTLEHEIRQHFLKLYPKSFPVFSINKQLIGGVRFFINGQVEDFTWFSKVQKIHNLFSHA